MAVLQPNQIVAGRYRVIRHLAHGGMGAVYVAEHLATEARVALKVLSPLLPDTVKDRRHFDLEAKVAARVNSENIVSVHDAGVDPITRSPYLAMELLSGETLAARVRRSGPLLPGDAIEVLRQVARGLDAAHAYRTADGARRPIVHRDLKPENLFLSRRTDGSPLVKILDFGLAKVSSESGAISQDVRGTPLYMAFEQVAGEVQSPQTDIWAFGLIAYFALTGCHYWVDAHRAAPDMKTLFAEILTRPLVRPSERMRAQGLDPFLPPAFDTWLLTCMERAPAQRFPSAGVAALALERMFATTLVSRIASDRRGDSRATVRYMLAPSPPPVLPPAPAPADRPVARRPIARRSSHQRRGAALLMAGSTAAALAWGLARWPIGAVPMDARARVEPSSAPAATTAARGAADGARRLTLTPSTRGAAPASDPARASGAAPGPRVTVIANDSAAADVAIAPLAASSISPEPVRALVLTAAPPAEGQASLSASGSLPAPRRVQRARDACEVYDPYNERCAIKAGGAGAKR